MFLFDEPLSNLDAKLRVQMRAEIKELHQRLKTTTIYVTHDQVEAMTMADRIVVMRDGVIEQMGQPLELYDRPATQFVAGFIGSPSMNFLPGKLDGEDGPVFISDDGLRLPLRAAPPGADGRPCVLGIRPEHLALGGPLEARVAVTEPTGSETQVFATLGGHRHGRRVSRAHFRPARRNAAAVGAAGPGASVRPVRGAPDVGRQAPDD